MSFICSVPGIRLSANPPGCIFGTEPSCVWLHPCRVQSRCSLASPGMNMVEWAGLLDSATRGQNWENGGKSLPGMLMSWGWGVIGENTCFLLRRSNKRRSREEEGAEKRLQGKTSRPRLSTLMLTWTFCPLFPRKRHLDETTLKALSHIFGW